MKQRFFICDHMGHGSPCIFTKRTMEPLWKRTGGEIPRCIRHGQLLCNGGDFETKEDARKWATKENN